MALQRVTFEWTHGAQGFPSGNVLNIKNHQVHMVDRWGAFNGSKLAIANIEYLFSVEDGNTRTPYPDPP